MANDPPPVQQPLSPQEFRAAYMRLIEPVEGKKPDMGQVFFTFPESIVESAGLAPADRAMLLEAGLPRRVHKRGLVAPGTILFDESAAHLLVPLSEIGSMPENRPDWTELVVLADIDIARYLCLHVATRDIWIANPEHASQRFVNSNLEAYAAALCVVKWFQDSLAAPVQKGRAFDEQRAQELAMSCQRALGTIDARCVGQSATWPRCIDEELAYWRPECSAPARTALPSWAEVRDALAKAIRAALPLQIQKAEGEPIAGIGIHMDAYYGSSGLYLLPQSVARALDDETRNNIGDWPISTDWNPNDDHAQAFAAHWRQWDTWFYEHLDDTDDESDVKGRSLLRIACEAMREIESEGLLDTFSRTEDFRIIIAEHDEPNDLSVERYQRFVETGRVCCHGDEV